ncbi:hypothetical protein BGX38DRAFT_1142426 [Terfezia claveryi]|nr:hypothetical protein BGX38DRAFT_1142426 [Terfezia claveryi]
MAKKKRPAGRSAAPAGATAVTSTIQTTTIPTSAQQPRRNSCTITTRRLRSSVGSEDGQRQGQLSSVLASAQPASSIPSSAQQPQVTRRAHIGKHPRSSVGPDGGQQESQPTGYHPEQLPKRRRISPSPGDSRPTHYLLRQIQQPPKPQTRATKALQPSSSRSKNAQNNASPRRPSKQGPPSDQPRSSKRRRPTPTPPPIPPPPQPGVRLLIHTSAPSNASQDALYRKQAVAVLRGFGAAAYMSLSSTSFELPTYEDGESIPDRQVDPRDAWMSTVGEELGTYDEDLEAMFRRYDKPRVVEAAKPEKKPQKEVKMKEDEVVTESPPEVSLQVEDDSQQNAQTREKLPSLGSTQYSSLGFLLPDVESWEAPEGSIAESQAQDGNTVEAPSSPILPQNRNREDVNMDVEEMGMHIHIPSSQAEELAEGIAEASFPEILTGDLTSPEFLSFESVKGKRETQKGKGKGEEKDIREQAGLSSPAYQVLRESALNTPAPQRKGSSPDILSTTPPLQGNRRKQRGGRRYSDGSQEQAQARPAPRPPFAQSLAPHSVAPSIRSQTTKKPSQEASTPPVRGPRIDKAKRSITKGKSKSQLTLNAPALQLSQFKSSSQRTSGRYATRSYSQIEVQPPPPPSSPSPLKKPQAPPPPCSPKQNREFFYAPSAPTPLHLSPFSPSQLPPSLPSTASSLPLIHLPPFLPPSTYQPPPSLNPRPPATRNPPSGPLPKRSQHEPATDNKLPSTARGETTYVAGAGAVRWEGRREKVQFWDKLRGNVLRGRLGMVGVFLGSEDGEGAEEGGDTVKVYCWGKVAELVWAFLFVISDRRTKMGLRVGGLRPILLFWNVDQRKN